jgi:hypothetical protein
VGEDLRSRRLVDETASRGQDPCNFAEGPLGTRDVVAGPEVEDDIEGAIEKGQAPHIGLEQLRRDAARVQATAGSFQQDAVYI